MMLVMVPLVDTFLGPGLYVDERGDVRRGDGAPTSQSLGVEVFQEIYARTKAKYFSFCLSRQ